MEKTILILIIVLCLIGFLINNTDLKDNAIVYWTGMFFMLLILGLIIFLGLGGGGIGKFILCVILAGIISFIAIQFIMKPVTLGTDKFWHFLTNLAPTAVPILIWVNLVMAVIDIIAGFSTGSSGLLIAGALSALFALSSSPVVSPPSALGLLMDVVGLLIGSGAVMTRAAVKTFG